jgi:Transposase DDE domain
MYFVPKFPKKVQFLFGFSFRYIKRLSEKTTLEKFVGGRPGYDKEFLFVLLLIKKVTNWSFRTVAEMGDVSHSTLVRANGFFLKRHVYEKFLTHLIHLAYKKGLIPGRLVAMDSSFVQTFSRKEEFCSEGWNEFKKAYGFKLHLLIDCQTKFPIALIIGNGIAHDSTLAIPLLRKAKRFLKKEGYVLADKGYDSQDIVNWIVKELERKAGIPIRKMPTRGKNYTWEGAWRNFHIKAKGRTLKKSIYNWRTEIERIFANLKRTFHLGKEETRGFIAFTKNCYLTLICYTLKLFNITKTS